MACAVLCLPLPRGVAGGADWGPLLAGSRPTIGHCRVDAPAKRLCSPGKSREMSAESALRGSQSCSHASDSVCEELLAAAGRVQSARSRDVMLAPQLQGVKLHPYQEEGVRWLLSMWRQGLGGILVSGVAPFCYCLRRCACFRPCLTNRSRSHFRAMRWVCASNACTNGWCCFKHDLPSTPLAPRTPPHRRAPASPPLLARTRRCRHPLAQG